VNNWIPRIGEQMRVQAARWFTAAPLARYAETFINEKVGESLKFGQLVVLHYYMFEGKEETVYRAAAAVELFILASDILDDLQDCDSPAKPWMQIPRAEALHVASALLALALHCTDDVRLRAELLDMMNEQGLKAANGQMLDLMNQTADELSYIEMIKQKSGALIVLACQSGVMLAGQARDQAVEEYAIEIGVASQLKNDVNDLLRWDDKSDFLQKKRTLVTLFLLESLAEEDQWISDYYEDRLSRDDIAAFEGLFAAVCERTGALLYGSVMSRQHYNRFIELLEPFADKGPWTEMFLQILKQKIA
jgi:competence protein ComQ